MHVVVDQNGNVSGKSSVLVAESPKVVPESRIVIASEPFLQHILEEQKTSILIPNKNAHIVLS
jgi:hypothetical protein